MKPTPLDLRREDYPTLDGARIDRLLRAINTSVGSLVQILAGQASFTDNLRAVTREVTFTTRSEWIDLVLLNSWTADRTPQYRWYGSKVEFRGSMAPGTTGADVSIITLPTGTYPAASRVFPVVAISPGGTNSIARLDVKTTGTANLESATFPLGILPLDGVAWEPATPKAHPNAVFPISVKNDLGAAPAGVWVWSASDLTDSKAVPVALGPVAWSVSKDQVVISDIGNVCPGRKYRVKLVLIAG